MDGDVFESSRVATFNISSSIIWSTACWHYTAKASAQHWHSSATVFPEFRRFSRHRGNLFMSKQPSFGIRYHTGCHLLSRYLQDTAKPPPSSCNASQPRKMKKATAGDRWAPQAISAVLQVSGALSTGPFLSQKREK